MTGMSRQIQRCFRYRFRFREATDLAIYFSESHQFVKEFIAFVFKRLAIFSQVN